MAWQREGESLDTTVRIVGQLHSGVRMPGKESQIGTGGEKEANFQKYAIFCWCLAVSALAPLFTHTRTTT